MTYVALLLDNLLGDLLLEEIRQLLGKYILTVFERSRRRPQLGDLCVERL